MIASIKNRLRITTGLLNDDWRNLKLLTKQAIQKGNYSEVFRLLEGMGYFGWKYNFIPDFSDDEVEDFIVDLALKTGNQLTSIRTNSDKIIFYDFFVLENRGFTQQYLDVIIKNNFELLYIVEDEKKYNEQNIIIKTIKKYNKGSVLILASTLTKVEKLNFILSEIKKFSPSKIFIHNSPWDILSCCFSYLLQQSSIKTFLLNITDHTFWPGKKCFSYFIDFRQYGSQLNSELRKIPSSQLLLIPTPAFIEDENNISFKGFPVDTENKVIGFAGGSAYKIIDKEKTFLNLIKEVLNENKNLIFLFANVDNDPGLLNFIKKNSLQKRFILIGNREDINEVFKRIDVFFNTYPYGGGLMIQYSILNRKPVLSLWNKELMHTRIDKVLDVSLDDKYVIQERTAYLNTAKKLIQDKHYRNQFAEELCTKINTQKEFENKLLSLLHNDLPTKIKYDAKFIINTQAVTDFHIDNGRLNMNEYISLANTYLSKNLRYRKQYKLNYLMFTKFLRKFIPQNIKELIKYQQLLF